MRIEAIRNRQSETPRAASKSRSRRPSAIARPTPARKWTNASKPAPCTTWPSKPSGSGELRTAYIQFQEAHLAFPDCYFGLRSIERMTQIETRARQRRKSHQRRAIR